MSTQIKRLYLNKNEFVPITLAEAVVVQATNIPGLSSLGITTLDKVLRTTLGIVSTNTTDIAAIEQAVTNINTELANKQDKLTAGNGIDISEDGTISVTHTTSLYKVVTSLPTPSADCMNIIYVVPTIGGAGENIYTEFLCIETIIDDRKTYKWEEIGKLQTSVDLSGYVTNETFNTTISSIQTSMITAEDVTLSNKITAVVVSYDIPDTLYDSLVNNN